MSNVLIGIIGVILFIGLALAAALFLGPQFQESTNNSRASAAVQAVSQVSNAANMYTVQEGHDAAAVADLTTGQYLKSVPSNITGGAAPALDTTNNIVSMDLDGTNGEAICNAIVKQTGQALVADAAAAGAAGPAGCYGDAVGGFFAYARI